MTGSITEVRKTEQLTFATVRGSRILRELAQTFGTYNGQRPGDCRYMFQNEHFDQFVAEWKSRNA